MFVRVCIYVNKSLNCEILRKVIYAKQINNQRVCRYVFLKKFNVTNEPDAYICSGVKYDKISNNFKITIFESSKEEQIFFF